MTDFFPVRCIAASVPTSAARARPAFAIVAALLVAVVATVGTGPAAAAAADPARSQVKFAYSQMNVAGDGDFKKFSADVNFDPAKPEAGKVSLTIDMAGVDAGSSDANDLLKTAPFFDVAKFPRATFVSTAIKAAGPGRFVATGDLTVKGRASAVTVPFVARTEGAGQWLEGVVPVSRTGLHVGEGEWADVGTLADAVQVRFKLFVPR
jgi:polyisoprenoid-binding protein YceI